MSMTLLPKTTTTPADVDTLPELARNLFAAADRLETVGWAQGDFERMDGRQCAVGAIMFVRFGFADHDVIEWEDLSEVHALAAHIDVAPCDVPAWNDNDDREMDDVVNALRAAALIESAR